MATRISFVEQLSAAERHLSRRDAVLRPVIRRHGPCSIRPHRNHFETLVIGIVSQQLSARAATTILDRFKALYAPARFPSAVQIVETDSLRLREVGLSGQKSSYLKDLASRTAGGTLKLARLSTMSDDRVIERLVEVKGIGVWTAHMFLMFSLGRLNVLPVGDLGIRKAIEKAYGLDKLPQADEIEQIAKDRQWHPFCSVASWYLWRSLEG